MPYVAGVAGNETRLAGGKKETFLSEKYSFTVAELRKNGYISRANLKPVRKNEEILPCLLKAAARL